MPNWLITGGCGFIGRNLIRALARDEEARIRLLDDLSVRGTPGLDRICPWRAVDAGDLGSEFAAGRVELVVGTILDAELVRRAAAGADTIVHLAASPGVARSVEAPLEDLRVNVLGTLHCLEAARRGTARSFILASSGAAVGDSDAAIDERTVARPRSPYGAGKLAAEGYCSAYHGSFGIDTVALRFSNVYGPFSAHKQSVVARFIRRSLAGDRLEIHDDGGQTRDFLFVEDLVRSILAAAAVADGGQVVQIASGRETTILELVETLGRVLRDEGLDLPARRFTERRVGDIRRSRVDAGGAQRLLGWRAEVGLAGGLARTVRWFRQREEQREG